MKYYKARPKEDYLIFTISLFNYFNLNHPSTHFKKESEDFKKNLLEYQKKYKECFDIFKKIKPFVDLGKLIAGVFLKKEEIDIMLLKLTKEDAKILYEHHEYFYNIAFIQLFIYHEIIDVEKARDIYKNKVSFEIKGKEEVQNLFTSINTNFTIYKTEEELEEILTEESSTENEINMGLLFVLVTVSVIIVMTMLGG